MTQTTHYASVLAKIGAERSKLLNETKIKAITEVKTLQEFASQLRDTAYLEQISKITAPLTSRKLERAFQENLLATIIRIIKHSPKSAQSYLSLYLYRFEIENIKTLVKATNARLSAEQKLSKIYLVAEDYFKNRQVIEDAAKVDSLRKIVNVLKSSDYGLALSMGLQSYEEGGSVACMDVLLDKVYFEKLFDAYERLPINERSQASFYAGMTNDGFTLTTLLRGKLLSYDPDWLRLAVPRKNLNLNRETVEDLVTATDFNPALRIALESYYSQFVVKGQAPEETIANTQKAFEKAVLQYAKASRISENFSIGAALAFLTMKQAEVNNLIAIGLGVEAGVKPEEIQLQLLL